MSETPILPDLTPPPGIQIRHPLDLLTEAERAWVREALAEILRVHRQALETPALDAIANASDFWWGSPGIQTPNECPYCVFATVVIDAAHDAPNPGDPGEGYYDCALLSLHAIWGENPKCTPEDWQQRMRTELAALHEAAEK